MADEEKGGGPTPPMRASDFATLSAFLRGYLHQDFRAEHETVAGAVEAYCREAAPPEVDRLRTEVEHFVSESRALPFEAVQGVLMEFHSGWLPASPAKWLELVKALNACLRKRTPKRG